MKQFFRGRMLAREKPFCRVSRKRFKKELAEAWKASARLNGLLSVICTFQRDDCDFARILRALRLVAMQGAALIILAFVRAAARSER